MSMLGMLGVGTCECIILATLVGTLSSLMKTHSSFIFAMKVRWVHRTFQ
jgi:hypothetical protein